MSSLTTTIPAGSWVLVTGVTGFVGAQTAKQFLERGYRVRGAVRDLGKASWLVDRVLKQYADSGDFELAVVPDLGADHAFDEAVRGTSAVIHVASVVTFEADAAKVIPPTVAGAVTIMEAALSEPSVKAFVYTSSIVASTMPVAGNTDHVDYNSWNDKATELAWAPPPHSPAHGLMVYEASKVAAEKAVWKFAEEKKPHFIVNCVLPSMIIGEPLDITQSESKSAWLKLVYDGHIGSLERLAAWVVDVKDTALLHVAAALDPEVNNARIAAWGHGSDWDTVLDILRKIQPEKAFVDRFPEQAKGIPTTDQSQALVLLQKWGSQEGWRPLEVTIADNVRGIRHWRSE